MSGPWLVCAALVLLAVAARRAPRLKPGEGWTILAVVVAAAAVRWWWGIWGPLHVNGQGPLWIRGALAPDPLVSYGPGYFELFGWIARRSAAPEVAIFAANAALSAFSPGLFYATARLAGVARGGALAGALVLAADPVIAQTAASEGYVSALIALLLATQLALALGLRTHLRGDVPATAAALGAAGLLAAAAARIHPMAYVPLALSPLLVLGAAQPDGWSRRLARTTVAGAVIGVVVTFTSGAAILGALSGSPMTQQAFAWPDGRDLQVTAVLLVALWLLHRWAHPPWLFLLGMASLLLLLATENSFQQHPLWNLNYQRVFLPGMLLGAVTLWPRRLQGRGWALVAAGLAVAVLAVQARPYLGTPTTEQLEHRFLQEVLRAQPADCTLAAVSRAGNRIWEIPSYLVPSSGPRGPGLQRAIQAPADLAALPEDGCLLYVRSSLCNSFEGRALCDAVERDIRIEPVASRTLPAVPSYVGLPYDRPEVEVVVSRVSAPAGASQVRRAVVSDGAAITPEVAQSLFEQLAPLREADGCHLEGFDTSRFRIAIVLRSSAGVAHAMELATAPGRAAPHRAGDWALGVPPELERDCGATLAAIERVLMRVEAPGRASWDVGNYDASNAIYAVLAATFVLLALWTTWILLRELRAQRPSPYAVLALVLIWGAALLLRLQLSPRTFLHEYYHVAETVSGYLSGEIGPAYGKTGPALFRMVGLVLGRPQDVEVIFLTNAVLASLAIPAAALLVLALGASWPQALTAAVLLAVLPHHLRFSAAEDLFVEAVTFGLWTAGLFALYLRTRRLGDVLCASLALSLALQTRPEMVFLPALLVALVLLVEPRAWRLLFAWRTLLGLSVAAALLVPRALELLQAVGQGAPAARVPDPLRYLSGQVLFDPRVTPPLYWLLLAVGMVWGLRRQRGWVCWLAGLYLVFSLFSFVIFDNSIFNLRSQLLPASFLVLVAAGAAPVWMAAWGRRRHLAHGLGALALTLLAVVVVVGWRGFVTELRDQQLEWAFLERTVPKLPARGTLVTAVEVGGHNLDAFPNFLLDRAGKTYDMVEVRNAGRGDVAWPAPGDDLLYYQGMYCYFAFDDEPAPEPMTAPCRAVHERYVAEPLFVEDLATRGYSQMRYTGDGQGPFRIGFYRLKTLR